MEAGGRTMSRSKKDEIIEGLREIAKILRSLHRKGLDCLDLLDEIELRIEEVQAGR